MTTPLYHAECQGLSGLTFTIGDLHIFTMADDAHLYIVPQSSCRIKGRLPDAMAARITATHIEPRLWSLDRA